MKDLIRITLLALIICVLVTGCTQITETVKDAIVVTTSLQDKPVLVGSIPSDFPLVDSPAKLDILISSYGTIDQNGVYVLKKYQEMSGVETNFINTNAVERAEDMHTALMNKQDIDLIMRCRPAETTLTQYGENGLILDLAENDLLKNNAPNCWDYLQTHPDALASVTSPDGSIYSIPQINSGAELRVSRKIFINKLWLENVNMEVPTTTEEFYQVLKAFKEQDANGNGDPNDEIPLSSHDWVSIQDILFGAFGLGNRGVHNQTVDFDNETGKVRLIAASDGYRDYLEYLNRLYTEGLLDNNIFTSTEGLWFIKCSNDQVGAFAHTNLGGVPAAMINNWVAVEEALEGPNGDKLWAPIRADFHSVGAAFIPATCDDPELVLRWLDYFWTDEGTLFYHMGIQDDTFVYNEEDGSYDYAPHIYEEMEAENKSFDEAVAIYSPYPGGGNPTVETAPYFRGGEMSPIPAAAARKLFEYGPEVYWPSFTFTDEENEKLSTIQADITKYIESSRTDFITGAESLSEWDGYLAQLEALGESELLNIYQAAVDRYDAFAAEL